jgi:hypothetical protein
MALETVAEGPGLVVQALEALGLVAEEMEHRALSC